eukprot:TRINITY_DN10808_c0_g1_i6.p1 TRINITY_DN10808_c0_g1~~TRINITY_DN10808_c0_g1_i6.p1  ORF type:complete len:475 (-),score=144.79 TRINITY_DN10808_c0_g1_i6:133-1557(-)
MLPHLLCQDLCSLNPGVDRLAYSVIWQMNEDGEVCEDAAPWFGRTVIRSCAKLDYGVVQEMIEGRITEENCNEMFLRLPAHQQPSAPHTPLQVVRDCLMMNRIAQARRKWRYDGGALSLQKAKLNFVLGADGMPLSFSSFVAKDSNKLVEEYMLLANQLVAQQLVVGVRNLALLRRHPPPVENRINECAEMVNSLGYEFSAQSAGSIFRSLQALRQQTRGKINVGEAVELLCTRPFLPAEYFNVSEMPRAMWRHYALNMDMYTHFTSPIRRYADVMVHRLLSCTLDGSLPRPTAEDVSRIAKHCNHQKMASRKAQDQSSKVFLALLLKDRPMVVQAVVVGLGPGSFSVAVPDLGLEKRLVLEELDLESFKLLNAKGAKNHNGRAEANPDSASVKAAERLYLEWENGAVQEFGILDPVYVRLSMRRNPIDVVFTLLPPNDADIANAYQSHISQEQLRAQLSEQMVLSEPIEQTDD